MSAVLLAIAGLLFPVVSIIAAVWFLLSGEVGLALFFFIWWLLWAE